MMGGYGGMMGAWGFGMGLAWVMPLVVMGLITWVIVSLTRQRRDDVEVRGSSEDRSARRSLRERREPDALSLAILQERFAEGDLDAETYRRMRDELER